MIPAVLFPLKMVLATEDTLLLGMYTGMAVTENFMEASQKKKMTGVMSPISTGTHS